MSRLISAAEARMRRLRGWLRPAVATLARARDGSTAVEFAFALPIILLLSLGTIECGLIVFQYHRAGEATRALARAFEIDPPVTSYATLPLHCPGAAACDFAKISAAVANVQTLLPGFAAANLSIDYRATGLDDAATMPGVVTPTVTVSVINLQYYYLVLGSVVPGIGLTLTLPPFSTTRVVTTSLAM